MVPVPAAGLTIADPASANTTSIDARTDRGYLDPR